MVVCFWFVGVFFVVDVGVAVGVVCVCGITTMRTMAHTNVVLVCSLLCYCRLPTAVTMPSTQNKHPKNHSKGGRHWCVLVAVLSASVVSLAFSFVLLVLLSSSAYRTT